MTEFKNRCAKCTQTNFQFFPHMDDPAFKKAFKQATGQRDHNHPFLSAILFLVVAFGATLIFTGTKLERVAQIIQNNQSHTPAQSQPAQTVQTAASSAAITH
jgi:hypothetical protein